MAMPHMGMGRKVANRRVRAPCEAVAREQLQEGRNRLKASGAWPAHAGTRLSRRSGRPVGQRREQGNEARMRASSCRSAANGRGCVIPTLRSSTTWCIQQGGRMGG